VLVSQHQQNLSVRMAGFERRLRNAWSGAVPRVPRHLQAYHEQWLQDVEAPMVGTSYAEMRRALSAAELIVVSDYHPLLRSRTGLAQLIEELPATEPLVLVLELLPFGVTLTAGEALRELGPALVTGQGLLEAYRPVLEVLAGRRGRVVGAWKDGSVSFRDDVAADVWQRIDRHGRRCRAIFHFGDWHLAAAHLPAKLTREGVEPMVIHQSPEPVWERLGANPADRTLRSPAGHWIWLHTPPLSLWANLHQELARQDQEVLAEAAEHLCESASGLLASSLDLPTPSCRLTVMPSACWPEFHSHLPRHRAAAFDPQRPPRQAQFHPRLPLAWAPRRLDLSDLIQGAAHNLICDSPLQAEVSFHGGLRRSTLCFLLAHMVNPFLQVSACEQLIASLWPDHSLHQGRELAREAARLSPGSATRHQLEPQLEMLLERLWGQQVGAGLAIDGDLGASAVHEFLDLGIGDFDWEALTATIRVA
jgi:hypothetical protein